MNIRKTVLVVMSTMLCALLIACSSVSFTHANGEKGQSITNAEVQPDNTVVIKYPNGSACIDTNPGESQVCHE